MSHKDDCDCKDDGGMVDVYLVRSPILNESRSNLIFGLIQLLQYTYKQATIVLETVNNKGDCYIFRGNFDTATSLIEKLEAGGLKCEARSGGLRK